MIVRPDFPEHRKTRLLVQLTGDEITSLIDPKQWATLKAVETEERATLKTIWRTAA